MKHLKTTVGCLFFAGCFYVGWISMREDTSPQSVHASTALETAMGASMLDSFVKEIELIEKSDPKSAVAKATEAELTLSRFLASMRDKAPAGRRGDVDELLFLTGNIRREAEAPDGQPPAHWDTPKRLAVFKATLRWYRSILRNIYDDEYSLATSGDRPRIPILEFPK